MDDITTTFSFLLNVDTDQLPALSIVTKKHYRQLSESTFWFEKFKELPLIKPLCTTFHDWFYRYKFTKLLLADAMFQITYYIGKVSNKVRLELTGEELNESDQYTRMKRSCQNSHIMNIMCHRLNNK